MQDYIGNYKRGKQTVSLAVNVIVLLGFLFEFINFSDKYSSLQWSLQMVSVLLMFATLILHFVDKNRFYINNYLAISYCIILNILITLVVFQDFYMKLQYSSSEFFSRDIFLMMALICFVGFIAGKKHIIFQGILLLIYITFELIWIGHDFIIDSAPIYYLTSIGYCWVLYFLVNILYSIMNDLNESNRKIKELHLSAQNKKSKLEQFNKATINLSNAINFDKTQITENSKSFEVIIRTVAENLNCSRVSIWLLSKDKTTISKNVLYQNNTYDYSPIVLSVNDFPTYFHSILTLPYIVASDARTNAATVEFSDVYLKPQDIYSLLDVPIKMNNSVMGVICCENQGMIKEWEDEEVLFAQSIADFIAIQLKDIEIKNLMLNLEMTNDKLVSSINELNATQAHLVQSEKMASLGVLASGVAHEINNPLNFISGGVIYLEMYLQDKLPDVYEEVKPVIEGINIGVKRTTTIVKSLGQYSRSNESISNLCVIRDIIDDCLVILHNQFKNKIEIQKDYTSVSYELEGNEGKLHQAFLNVLSNAGQAIHDKGLISIRTSVVKRQLLVEISDTGEGISEDNMKKIFDPFFTTKGPNKGTGLGLSITYSIIQDHRGTISYTSQLGHGTQVKITFPIKINAQ